MTFQAVVQRHRRIMEDDWSWRAEEIALDIDEDDVSEGYKPARMPCSRADSKQFGFLL